MELQRRTHKISELTQMGYLMAAMTNKVEKATKKLNTEASQDAIKQTKRFISNFDAELTSIEAQDIEEFNLRIRLLSDFEQLSDLYDKLEDDIDDVMEFLVEFSQFFSEAKGVEDFKEMNNRMRNSLNAVKRELGMPIEEEEDDIPEEEVTIRLEKEIIPLQEVIIRFADPELLLTEALNRIRINYLDDTGIDSTN